MEDLVRRAQEGDREALEQMVAVIQGRIYRLALHMLWHPEDARDATQEILIRIITHLGSFRGESSFQTWTYRVATNWLLNARKQRMERSPMTFQQFGEDLDEGLAAPSPEFDDALLMEEVKIGCTLGMLLCLDRRHRLAFILGEILELDQSEAAAVLEISPTAFRKRLSRARTKVIDFTRAKCGLVNSKNQCRCRLRVDRAIEVKRVDPQNLLFAHDRERARRFPAVLEQIRKLDAGQCAVALYRSHPDLSTDLDLVSFVRNLAAGLGMES